MFAILEPLKERVAVIISADLAHTHLASGPYGYSNASQPFDDVRALLHSTAFAHPPPHIHNSCSVVGCWNLGNSPSLLTSAAGYVDWALSCRYTGLVMLHGLLEARLVGIISYEVWGSIEY